MGTSPGIHSFDRWASESEFAHLFKRFLVDPSDPEVLLVGGLVYPDGTIELTPLYHLDEGVPDDVSPGDYSLELLDPKGAIVQTMTFGLATTVFGNPYPPAESDIGIFTLTIPYPKDAQELRILTDETVIADVIVTTQMLRDAIETIPDYGFVMNPSQRRSALLNKVDAMERILRQGDIVGAENKLENDIRKHLQEWLKDDYEKQNVLTYTKGQILALVEGLTERLDAQSQEW